MSQRILTAYSLPKEVQHWYPLAPRWIPLLRIGGVLCALGVGYRIATERPSSLADIARWAVMPGFFVLYCLCVQPERRIRTFLTRLGSIAHLLLVWVAIAISLLVAVRWIRL